jgi:CRP-like cAMP-binding protein
MARSAGTPRRNRRSPKVTQTSNVILFDAIRNRKPMIQNPIFPHLTRDDWHAIFDHGDFVSFDDRAIILHEDVQNSALFYIDEGEVRIVRHEWGREIELARLGPGSVFGEMSMLENAPVGAAVIADGCVDAIRIERAELEQVLGQDDKLAKRFFRSLAETVAKRLRATGRNVKYM